MSMRMMNYLLVLALLVAPASTALPENARRMGISAAGRLGSEDCTPYEVRILACKCPNRVGRAMGPRARAGGQRTGMQSSGLPRAWVAMPPGHHQHPCKPGSLRPWQTPLAPPPSPPHPADSHFAFQSAHRHVRLLAHHRQQVRRRTWRPEAFAVAALLQAQSCRQ